LERVEPNEIEKKEPTNGYMLNMTETNGEIWDEDDDEWARNATETHISTNQAIAQFKRCKSTCHFIFSISFILRAGIPTQRLVSILFACSRYGARGIQRHFFSLVGVDIEALYSRQ
jgi:hypothetical protein